MFRSCNCPHKHDCEDYDDKIDVEVVYTSGRTSTKLKVEEDGTIWAVVYKSYIDSSSHDFTNVNLERDQHYRVYNKSNGALYCIILT